MAPAGKRQRVFSVEEARDLVTMEAWSMDSDSDESSSDEDSSDESVPSSPTRSISRAGSPQPERVEPMDFLTVNMMMERMKKLVRKMRMTMTGFGWGIETGVLRGTNHMLTNPGFFLTLQRMVTDQLIFVINTSLSISSQ